MARFSRAIWILTLCMLLLFTACGAKTPKPSGDYAGLTAEEAAQREIDARGLTLTEAEETAARENAEQDYRALVQAGEAGEETVETLTAQYRFETLFAKLQAELVSPISISDQEARAWYDARYAALKNALTQNAATFKPQQDLYDVYGGVPPLIVPEGFIRFKHILVTELSTAQEILDRLERGDDFETLLDIYCIDETMLKEPYRTIGYLTGREPAARDFLTELRDAALSLESPGDVSGIVESAAGFHVVQLTEKLNAGEVPFDEVKDAIKALLKAYQENQQLWALLESWTK